MKLKILIVSLIVVGLSACTQKTCPTYAKQDVNKANSNNTELVKV